MAFRNTREILLKSAVQLFHQKGYSDTSIREIGAKANITNSIIYHYFKNKDEILFQIIYKATQDLIQTLHKIADNVSDPVECLEELIKEHTATFGFNREAKVVISDSFQLRGKQREIIQEIQREIYNIYIKKLRELKDKGLLNDTDLTVANFSLFGIINSSFRWYREGGRLSREEVAKNILSLFFHGILNLR